MAFPNLYYKRTAATAKACYICYKPTTVVLATIDVADFFYTCPVHLTDRAFATRAPDPEKNPSVNPTEIARVKEDWEEKQRQKKEKEKDETQGKEDSQADGEGKNGTGDGVQKHAEGKEAGKQEKVPGPANAIPTASSSEGPPTSRPTHERYILHRDIFALRTADHRRRRQTTRAKNLAPRLPGAPRSLLP